MDRDDRIRQHCEQIIKELRAFRLFDIELNVDKKYHQQKIKQVYADMQKYRNQLEQILGGENQST